MRHVKMLSLTAALALPLCVCGLAWAGSPPLATDDPETPGAGAWEINITSSMEKTVDGTEVEVPLFDINHGFLANDQLGIEFAVLYSDPKPFDEPSEAGISDLGISYKYRFFEDESRGLLISTHPALSLPTGNERRGLGSGHTEMLIPLEFQMEFAEGRGWINPDIGYNVVFGHHKDNSIKWGVAVGYEPFDGFELMGEVAGLAHPEGPELNDVFFNVGFGYILTRNVRLLGSIGRSFHAAHRGTSYLTALVGCQLLFGPAAGEIGQAVAMRTSGF